MDAEWLLKHSIQVNKLRRHTASSSGNKPCGIAGWYGSKIVKLVLHQTCRILMPASVTLIPIDFEFDFEFDMHCTIFLRKFITEILFNSIHFNYNIHFLNIVSVRWRPLLSTNSRKRFWKFCITRCSILGEIAATSSLMFCFKSTVVLGFSSYTLLLRYPQRKKYRY
jgi:hypothetical protein